ncbi:MAG: CesT family type III secretion system chaperone [Gammaproteobacteria bacterium]|nr:CesT family type III secretion system chaperone [Gammaproteobacteria bacterium]MDE0365546.1 CesT family type III secretion system chaperone [Gammaproteobacteria bacterium]
MSRLPLLIGDFGNRNGIESLRPDEQGRYHMVVDDSVQVQCFERFGQLYLVSPLGPVPEPVEEGQRWLQRLLNHALKRMKHSHGTPALDEEGNAVFFARYDIANLSVVDLEARVSEHINVLESYLDVVDAAAPMQAAAGFAPSFLRP